jgi:hypothetical protein
MPQAKHTLATLFVLLAFPRTVLADPTTADCLSSYEQSINLKNRHELRAARAALLTCVAPTCPADVRDECAKRISDVNSLLPTIVIEAKDSEGNDLSVVQVTMDGRALVESLEGTALSIDPGEHVFVFTVEGWPPVDKRWVIREGEKERREKVVLAPPELPPPAVTVVVPQPEPPPIVLAAPVRPLPPEPDSTRRTMGIIVTALGVSALGVALYEQINAHNHYADSRAAAESGEPQQRASKHAMYEDAKSAQTAAIVFAAVGVGALVPGVYLLWSSLGGRAQRREAEASLQLTPWLSPRTVGVSCGRSF